MANDAEQLMVIMESFKSMLVGVEAAQVMQKYIRAYDQFATDAMKVVLQAAQHANRPIVAQEIAQVAWAMADAMMVERRKREIGGLEQVSKPPKDAVVPTNGVGDA